jgi:hypothetical protein
MKWGVHVKYLGSAVLNTSQLNSVLRDGFEYIGKYWHRNFRAKKFTQAAYSEYGYTPRKRGYNRNKMQKLGHTRPLEFTGASKLLSENKTVTATKNGVKVAMPVRAFNFRAKNSQVNMRKEFTTISQAEETKLNQVMEQQVVKKINRLAGFKSRRVG